MKQEELFASHHDDVGRAAHAYIDLLEKKKEIEDKIHAAGLTLADELIGANRTSIKCRGRVLTREEIQTKIRIKTTKDKPVTGRKGP